MKAAAVLHARIHAHPGTIFHGVMDKIHLEKISRAIDRVFFPCIYTTVIIGTTLLFTSTILQLQGRSIISLFSRAMAYVQWICEKI